MVNQNATQAANKLTVFLKKIAEGPGSHGFESMLQDFKDKNAGSLLLTFTAGGGFAVVSAEVSYGLAIDLDYLLYPYLNNDLAGFELQQGFSPIASLFEVGGGAIGPAGGGSIDFTVGYHLANPEGVGGPGIDVAMEAALKLGAGIGVGYDASTFPQFPPQLVTASAGLKTGVEIEASIGASYAEVLAQLCMDWSVLVDDEAAWALVNPVLVPDTGVDGRCENPEYEAHIQQVTQNMVQEYRQEAQRVSDFFTGDL